MAVPIDKIAGVLKRGASAAHDADEPVRIAVYLDASATEFLVTTVRDALVPQTTGAMVRVDRVGAPIDVRHSTDVAIVISCGSDRLQPFVQELVVAGAPVAVVAESSVEVPFIQADTPMLGLIASTSKAHLLEALARWILDRTDKRAAFAANFPFMRISAAMRVVTDASLGNMATGALVFIPGADFPVMAMQQVGMLIELASIYGKGLKVERSYEIAGVLAAGLALRAGARAAARRAGRMGFAVKALTAGFGTYAMGRALIALYERDVDYGALNRGVSKAASRARDILSPNGGAASKEAL